MTTTPTQPNPETEAPSWAEIDARRRRLIPARLDRIAAVNDQAAKMMAQPVWPTIALGMGTAVILIVATGVVVKQLL